MASVVSVNYFAEVAKNGANRVFFRNSENGAVKFLADRGDLGRVNFQNLKVFGTDCYRVQNGLNSGGFLRESRQHLSFFSGGSIAGRFVYLLALSGGGSRASGEGRGVPQRRKTVIGKCREISRISGRIASHQVGS